MRKHGLIITAGGYIGARWCKVCKYAHAVLYPCPHYDDSTLKEIRRLTDENRANWSNSDFIQKQLDGGMLPEGVVIMQMFAGLR